MKERENNDDDDDDLILVFIPNFQVSYWYFRFKMIKERWLKMLKGIIVLRNIQLYKESAHVYVRGYTFVSEVVKANITGESVKVAAYSTNTYSKRKERGSRPLICFKGEVNRKSLHIFKMGY